MFEKAVALSIRVLPEEKEALKRIGEINLLNMSEVVRLAIRQLAKEYGCWPPTDGNKQIGQDQ